jgi:formate--tetrahydrofolate ligase
VTRQTGFDITAASEVMAVLALSTSLQDMRQRLGRMVIGLARDGKPITADFLHAGGAMTVIMRDAIKPNLLQTLENTPVLVHAGPFGNIANGASSVLADLIGIHGGDFLVTEAGFGADMGAERFFNIKCRTSGLAPDAAVVVATVRALKVHSGKYRVVAGKPLPPDLLKENPDDVLAGAANLRKQVENIQIHGVTPVVAINAFPGDHASEHRVIRELAEHLGVRAAVCNNFADGGSGAVELAEMVAAAAEEPSTFQLLYPDAATLREKIETIALRIYGARGVEYDPVAAKQLLRPEAQRGADRLGAAGARGARLRRRGLHLSDLRRDAHDARPADHPQRDEHRHRRRRRDRRPVLAQLPRSPALAPCTPPRIPRSHAFAANMR